MQVNVFEAVRIATDPSGDRTAHARPTAKEVLERLGKLGFVVVPREMTEMHFTIVRADGRVEEH